MLHETHCREREEEGWERFTKCTDSSKDVGISSHTYKYIYIYVYTYLCSNVHATGVKTALQLRTHV